MKCKFHCFITAQNMKFSTMQFPADLITFIEEILNGKLHFLCSVSHVDDVGLQTYPEKFFNI